MQRNTIGLIGLGLGLVVLFILTATPIYVYLYLLPMSSSDTNQATASCQRIPIILLNRSVCSSVFPLWTSDEYRNRNISVSGCGYFTKAEEDFRFLRTLLPEIADDGEIMSVICHFAFKDCEEYANNSESSDDKGGIILQLSKYLKKFSKIDIADFLSLLETHKWCLTIPKGDRGDLRCKQQNTSETGICHKPLLPTLTKNAQERCLYCSPPCHEQPWKTGAKIFSVSLCVSVAIYWICIVVVFVTWAKAANPFGYQSITTLFLIASVFLYSCGVTIPAVMGQKWIFCKHASLIDSWIDPTTACHAQGLLISFATLSFWMWWLISVFNAVMTVLKKANLDSGRQRRLFCVQLTLSLIVPGGQLAFSLLKDVKFVRIMPYTPYCGQSSPSSFFYSYTLPANVIIMCGTIMSFFVMVKLHQAKRTECQGLYVNKKFAEAWALVQKRFFFLSILQPLAFASQMVTDIIYAKKTLKTIVECLGSTNQTVINRCLSNDEANLGWFASGMLNLSFMAVFFFAFVTYCLIPKSRRTFWLQLWRKCKKRQFRNRRNDDTTERPTAETSLFPSSTLWEKRTRRQIARQCCDTSTELEHSSTITPLFPSTTTSEDD